ncbi:lantibiotic dehydratase [Priestia filamentosa]|uniref:lantibiotic dehydratase n=1 Tax=Priestia filamentosa TaxID=1402861 RepID=UPI003981D57E
MGNMSTETVKRDIKEKKTFELLDNFMVRSPLLPLNFFHEKLSNVQLNNFDLDETLSYLKSLVSNNKVIREAIAVSSLSLFNSIEKTTIKSKTKDKRNVIKGIFRYLNRISTRTTPFGLCARVSMGTFTGGKSKNNSNQLEKKVRPDMEWINHLIKLLESDSNLVNQLRIKINQGIIINGSRAKLNYSTDSVNDNQGDKNYTATSINHNEITQQVFDFTKTGIVFKDLLHKMHSIHSDVEIDIIENFVYQLIQQEFLVTELRPSNDTEDALNHILGILTSKNEVHPITSLLQDIYFNIKFYEKTSLGDGLSYYLQIVEDMNRIVEGKNPLKIDLVSLTNDYHLTDSIKEDIEEVVELLCEFTVYNGGISNNELKEYHSDFLKHYGLDREVPILELLDEDLGLGAPNDYQYPPKNEASIQKSFGLGRVDKVFLDWITECNLKNQFELSLTDQHIQTLKNYDHTKVELPDSLDIYFSKIIEKEEQPKFVLSLNPYSTGGGTTLGRFINYFHEDYKKSWGEIDKREQKLHPNSIVAEVFPTPINKRNLNICQTGKRRDYQINITNNLHTQNNIDLTDLIVGATHDSLYVKSSSLGKEIIPLASHMLNPSLCPNVYRFLVEIGQQKTGSNYPYFFSNLTNIGLPFTPRITYKNFTLSPARWSIKNYTFEKCRDEQEFREHFGLYRKKLNIPQFVYLVHFDNKILLDLENKEHTNDLFREIKRMKQDSVISLLENLDTTISCKEHSMEFVFSLINRKETVIKDMKKNPSYKELPIIRDKERLNYPFERWIFAKIYCPYDRQEEFLGKYLYEFIQNDNWYEHFFFMRFKDPDFHIRVRFKGNSEELIHEGIPKIIEWTNELRKIGIINKLVFDTYDPEIERYGGPKVIELAEKLFHLDSCIALELIKKTRFENFSIPKDILSIINTGHYIQKFGFDYKKQMDWLDKRVNYKDFLKEFRENRMAYLDYFEKFVVRHSTLVKSDEIYLMELLTLREEYLERYVDNINLLNQQNILYSSIDNILDSLIHLHLNRLIGIDRNYETKSLTLFRHSLHKFSYHYNV